MARSDRAVSCPIPLDTSMPSPIHLSAGNSSERHRHGVDAKPACLYWESQPRRLDVTVEAGIVELIRLRGGFGHSTCSCPHSLPVR